MATTQDNLSEAFAGESQAFQKYTSFAEQADKDGFPNVAKLFRTAAAAERIHAAGHFKAMEGVSSTAANIQAAIDGETYEYTTMYPPMLDQAKTDDHAAKRMFAFAVKAEAVHAEVYKQALAAVQGGKDLDASQIYLCPVCGHIEFGAPPDACPICATKGSKYQQV